MLHVIVLIREQWILNTQRKEEEKKKQISYAHYYDVGLFVYTQTIEFLYNRLNWNDEPRFVYNNKCNMTCASFKGPQTRIEHVN